MNRNRACGGIYATMGLSRYEAACIIQGEAERFATLLREHGFKVSIEHSGSAAGPSSYLSVYDPDGRFTLNLPYRVSNHFKGINKMHEVHDVAGDEDFNQELERLLNFRKEKQKEPGYVPLEERRKQCALERALAEQAEEDAKRQRIIDAIKLKERFLAGEKLPYKLRKEVQRLDYQVGKGWIKLEDYQS
ncbi:hypothetical protein [Oligella urethralis]|uniref:Uncharacterized protein n=1 Tax=Oligella urethralis DNF00040 TaxID=1401065 RepID=A0A095YU53_9BURK|nr:hypothetical protein [Oligella urethralis]KGF25696.1 hypothetical protein HMPREF2130_10885 [Oligella urethralis DNF00040]